MKIIIVTIINLILNPILFLNFMTWASQLEYISFKRKQYILLTAHLTLWGFGFKQKFLQSILISIIFELDYEIDQKLIKNNEFSIQIKKIFMKSKYHDLLQVLRKHLDTKQYNTIIEDLNNFNYSASEIFSLKKPSLEEYLKFAKISIGVPCSTRLVSLISHSSYPEDTVNIAAEIIRIINDKSSIEKDKQEKTKNIYSLGFNKDTIENMLDEKLTLFKKALGQSQVDIFLKRLVKYSIKLYDNKKDFEL